MDEEEALQREHGPSPLTVDISRGIRNFIRTVLNIYGKDDSVLEDCNTFLTDLHSITEPPTDTCLLLYVHLECLIKRLLELQVSEIQQHTNDETLLRRLLDSWRLFNRALEELMRIEPFSSEDFTVQNGKSLKQALTELYGAVVIDQFEEEVRQATFRFLQREKRGEQFHHKLAKSVSMVFYWSFEMNWELYAEKWHGPIIQYICHLYFDDVKDWTGNVGILNLLCNDVKKFNSATSRVCALVKKYCPSDDITQRARRTLRAFARIKSLRKVKEILNCKDPKISFVLGRRPEKILKRIYKASRAMKELPFLSSLLLQFHVSSETAKLKSLIESENEKWFGSDRLSKIDDQVIESHHSLDSYLEDSIIHRRGHEGNRNERIAIDADSYRLHTEQKKLLNTLQNATKIQVSRMLKDEDSEVVLIFKRNRHVEIEDMYEACFNLRLLPFSVDKILGFEIVQKTKPVLESLRNSVSTWFESDSLLSAHSKIKEICRHVGGRCYGNITLRDQMVNKIEKAFEIFITERVLPTVLADENSAISLAFKHEDEEKVQRIYRICAELVLCPKVGLEVLKFEIASEMNKIKTFLRTNLDWFREPHLSEFHARFVAADLRVSRRVNWNQGAFSDPIRVLWRPDNILREVKKQINDEESGIGAVFWQHNTNEIRRLYQSFKELPFFKEFGTRMFRFQVSKDRAALVEVMLHIEREWFSDGWLSDVDAAVTEVGSRMIPYGEVYGIAPTKLQMDKLEHFVLNNKLVPWLHKMLDDDESEVSRILKSNSDDQITRMYQSCFNLTNLSRIGTYILAFDLRKSTRRIVRSIERMPGRWLSGTCFTYILCEVNKACAQIHDRCILTPQHNEGQQRLFRSAFERDIMKRLPVDGAVIVDAFGDDNYSKEADSLCMLSPTLAINSPHGTSLLEILMKRECEQIFVQIRMKATTPCTSPGPSQGPSLGMLLKNEELKELFKSLMNLRTKYERRATGHFTRRMPDGFSVAPILNQILSQGSNGETFVSLLADFVDTIMVDSGAASQQSQLRLVATIVVSLSLRERFRRHCERHMAKRLLRIGKLGTSDTSTPERQLIQSFRTMMGEAFVVTMLKLVNDFDNVQFLQEEDDNPMIRKIRDTPMNPRATSSETAMSFQPYIRVLDMNLWSIQNEEQLNLPKPFAGQLSRFKKVYKETEVNQELEYIHSLAKVTFETKLFSSDANEIIQIISSVHQASLLLLFNVHDSITMTEVLSTLQDKQPNNDLDYIIRTKALIWGTVRSLITNDCPLLKKDADSPEIHESDVLRVNDNFVAPCKVVQLPTVRHYIFQEEETNETRQLAKLLSVRKAIETLCMKLMKRERERSLGELFDDIEMYWEAKRFPYQLKIADFKKVMESLVERNFLASVEGTERDNPTISYCE